jgi:polysaccharide export outer membrane protein
LLLINDEDTKLASHTMVRNKRSSGHADEDLKKYDLPAPNFGKNFRFIDITLSFYCHNRLIIKILRVWHYCSVFHENYRMKAKKHFKIFLVDGNLFSLNIYEQHLLNLGYMDVSVFQNPADCISRISENPDIIFLDHVIQQSSTVEILKKIKRINPDIYVIFVASMEDTDAVIRSLKNGAFDFIVKGENHFTKLDSVIMKVHRVKLLLENSIPQPVKRTV